MKHQWGHRSGAGTYEDSVFGEDAEIFGSPFIKDSVISGGKVFDSPIITRSQLHHRPIVSGRAEIHDTIIIGTGIVADNSFVTRSTLYGDCRILDDARVADSTLHDNVVVAGTARVYGVELKGWTYIDRGIWHRPPLNFVAGDGWNITESEGDLVSVSCCTNTIPKWLGGAGRRYGRLVGMSEKEINEVQGYVEHIRDYKARERQHTSANTISGGEGSVEEAAGSGSLPTGEV